MNISVISRNIGVVLLLNALFMIISLVVSIFYGVDSSFSPLLLSAIITAVVGFFPLIFVRKSLKVSTKEGFFIAVFAWILSCIFGMLPYVLWGGEFTLINAWFESVSGYTTTGSTILNNVEALPKGLLFWRSSTHFIGGIGIIIFMLLLLPSVSTIRMALSKVEISSLSKENFNFRTNKMVRVIVGVYIGLTVAETICLTLAGMTIFDAVNHSFSTISTGGFSTKNLSILAYDSVAIEMIIMIFMFLSGLHFGLLYSFFIARTLKIFRSHITRYYFFCILFSGFFVAINIVNTGIESDWLHALRVSFFQVVSVASATGFASADSAIWPPFSILLLIVLTIQCACTGSTTGGIKVDRIYIVLSAIMVQIKKKIHINAVIPVRIASHTIDSATVSSAALFISLYFLLLFIGTLCMTLFGLDLIDSFSSVVASLGNVGPGFGSVGSLDNYNHFASTPKFTLSILMLFGRMEIYSILIIFYLLKSRWV